MHVVPQSIPEVLVLEPKVFGDPRGFFLESFNALRFAEATGLQVTFVQDNHSRSRRGVVRGLHYQETRPQGKLVRVVSGRIWDVAVERAILWNDPDLDIAWPLDGLDPIVSERDRAAGGFRDAATYP